VNWDAIGAVAELIGAAGVVASLAYLAVQIRSNTRSAQAATYQGLAQGVLDGNRDVFANPETASFLERALSTDEPFDPVAQRRWLAYCSAQFRHYDNVFHQHQMGSLRDSEFRSLISVARFNLRSARLRQSWRDMRGMFDDPYRSYMDELADKAEKPSPAV
jgi:hypothetical protein